MSFIDGETERPNKGLDLCSIPTGSICTGLRVEALLSRMDFIVATVIFCLVVAALFLGLWLYYDRRDYALFEHARRKSTFCCVRCQHLYSVAGRPELVRCPRCGHENTRLKF